MEKTGKTFFVEWLEPLLAVTNLEGHSKVEKKSLRLLPLAPCDYKPLNGLLLEECVTV